jgi:hypothetical protein
MKRNKRTVVVAYHELTPLTEHILSRMGQQGTILRKRLTRFYRERALPNQSPGEEKAEDPA